MSGHRESTWRPRRSVLVASLLALLAPSLLAIPAQASTKTDMRQALLNRAEITSVVPQGSGVLRDAQATKTRAYYAEWIADGEGFMSVTALRIAHVPDGQARPADVAEDGYGYDWKRIRRTDDRLVQISSGFSGESIRVVIFRDNNAVSAVCGQVMSIEGEPDVTRAQLRRCAASIAQAQMDKMRELLG